ncbi:RNA polymerase sigma factor [Agromyces sp. NPDC056379]|uniref:RNA polymerase sigma factor n=1 Tax=unclassified Agromyces TaxID=2639701 RepID=UPI0035D6971E
MDEPRDAELWGRSRQGDGAAFGVLFDRHRDRVFRHAWSMLSHRHDAEDVTATAFLELWRRRRDVRVVDGSVLPWLLVTTSNTALNASRSTRRYRRLIGSLHASGAHPDAADEVAARMPLDLDNRALADAMRGLGRVDAGLLALVALEGYQVAEAAALFDLTPGAAKTRLHRTKARVRDALAAASAERESTGRGRP